MHDLPSEDPEEPGLPDEFHLLQPELLRLTLSSSSSTGYGANGSDHCHCFSEVL
jgi:hypothetical protein